VKIIIVPILAGFRYLIRWGPLSEWGVQKDGLHGSVGMTRDDMSSARTTSASAVVRYALHERRSRRRSQRDADSSAWEFTPADVSYSAALASRGGTVTGPISRASSSGRSCARVARQYLGASSR